MKLSKTFNFIVFLFLAGCASAPIQYSGFLDDYDALIPSEIVEGLLVDKHPTKKIGDYSQFYIAPVIVYMIDGAKGEEVEPQKLEELAQFFHDQAVKALEENYTVVDQPKDGALIIRAAITDVVANKPYLNVHWSTTLAGFGLGGASMEAEFVDAKTKERVMAVVDKRKGKRSHYTKGLTKWGHTEDTINIWVGLLIEQLNNQHNQVKVDM